MKKRLQWIFPLLSVIVLLGITQCRVVPTVATSVPMPSATEENTSTPTPTQTLTSLPTASVTLNPTEEKDNILNLLRTNDNCDLPCWWGITPGKTTTSEAREISNKDNLKVTEYPTGFTRRIWLDFQGEIMQGQVEFGTKQNYIEYGKIDSFSLPTTTSTLSSFKRIWSRFAPEKLIVSLGIPSRIRIDATPGPSEGQAFTYVNYTLYIVYDQKGIRLVYTVRDDLKNKYRVCPTFGEEGNVEDSIGILLASPNDGVPIETYDKTGIQENRAIPIEKAAGITLGQFYNLFIQTGEPVCFNILPNTFPIP